MKGRSRGVQPAPAIAAPLLGWNYTSGFLQATLVAKL
jgi:hypothetical protein